MLTGIEVTAAIAGVKNLRDLISSWKDSTEKHKLSEALVSVQSAILDLQGALIASNQALAAAEERARLAQEASKNLVNWQQEEERYELTEVCRGVFVYTLRSGKENGEPYYYVCPACFASRRKSILQFEMVPGVGSFLNCPDQQHSRIAMCLGWMPHKEVCK